MQTSSKEPSEPLQDRIDRLERLLVGFMSSQTKQNRNFEILNSPTGQDTIEYSGDNGNSELTPQSADIEKSTLEHGSSSVFGQRLSSNSDSMVHINADYGQSPSLNEAHWALLLNEVDLRLGVAT